MEITIMMAVKKHKIHQIDPQYVRQQVCSIFIIPQRSGFLQRVAIVIEFAR